eukprot:Blabericola_migrator_1__11235@NODE_65_length_15685_cov_31_404533_g58_i0_p2_GENE_NODE_65_length_15685_cov_31_404533_g58_i0NODE_65_length_15685_cov_31_404533_g58_i0_p2_ORF_typecomplete_len922_score147_15PDEase_I/PF00233_19/1_2e66HD/PF01966_22/0_066RNA_pol_3_Rpc31/PF11705_8/9e02RNA_pol_3_Rpc31/PF11705_8/0_05_NODE_65_length_15685_cov_31_404533_g58_i0800110766
MPPKRSAKSEVSRRSLSTATAALRNSSTVGDVDQLGPASDASSASHGMWREIGTKSGARYKKDLYRGWWLSFRDSDLEKAFGVHLLESYRIRSALAAFWTAILVLLVWTLFSILMHKGTLWIADKFLINSYDVLNSIGFFCALLLYLGRYSKWARRHGEAWFLGMAFVIYTCWLTWNLMVLVHGYINNAKVIALIGINIMVGIQFKFWTDSASLIMLFLLCTLYDQLMKTRTKYTLWLHVLAVCIYVVVKIMIVPVAVDPMTGGLQPSVIILAIVQTVVAAGLVAQCYMGIYQKETVERIAFLDIHDDHVRLKEVREAQRKRKKAKGESMVEDLIHQIRKAQTSLQDAAFNRTGQGDASLLEMDEVLRQCVEILLDTDDLFAVGGDGEGGAGDSDDEENQYVNMLQSRKRGGHQGQEVHKSNRTLLTGEDCLRRVVQQQEFFTPDIMPEFNFTTEMEEQAGQECSLRLLEMYKSNPNVLVECGHALLKPHFELLNVSEEVIIKYLYQIQRRYYANPYHNSCHGAVVAHMAVCVSRLLGLDSKVTEMDMLSLVIGGLGHDVGHPGRNNNFYINQCQTMARMYKDVSILEQYHSFLTFRYALIGSEVNIFQGLTEEQYRLLRAMIIENILVTDMAQHFSSISKFRVRRASEKFDLSKNIEDAQFVLRLCMKIADLSHALVDWNQHMDWSLRVTEEFYQQGAVEEANGMPISPLCDRNTHKDFAKSQSGFLQFVVIPLANELGEIDEQGLFSGDLLTKVLFNKHKWDMLKEKGDFIVIPPEISGLQTAPPFFADSILLQALRSRTVDEINADPKSVIGVQEVIVGTKERKEAQMAAVKAREAGEFEKGSKSESQEKEKGKSDESDESDESFEDEDEDEDMSSITSDEGGADDISSSPSSHSSPPGSQTSLSGGSDQEVHTPASS